ncbi:MAG: hypothetical protein RL069_2270, partial [Planctomycetota bacterium]
DEGWDQGIGLERVSCLSEAGLSHEYEEA